MNIFSHGVGGIEKCTKMFLISGVLFISFNKTQAALL